jgi:hypothetical protein
MASSSQELKPPQKPGRFMKVISFQPNPDYKGPSNPRIAIRPHFVCGSSAENSNAAPTCSLDGNPVSVPLNGQKGYADYTITFNWTEVQDRVKDVLTFSLTDAVFDYTVDGTPFERARVSSVTLNARLDGMLLRCDRGAVQSGSNGCVFPKAAAVYVESTGDSIVAEHATHMAEALAAGAPGTFKMKDGFRAIADDSVRGDGKELTRASPSVVRDANSWWACSGASDAPAVITVRPKASSACAAGANCQCDEFPFASTWEGAWKRFDTTSAKRILQSANSSAGGRTVDFYNKQRILDLSYEKSLDPGMPSPQTPRDPIGLFEFVSGGDAFWVRVTN